METTAIIDWISVTAKSGKLAVSDWTNTLTIKDKGMLGYSVQVVYDDGRIELSNPSRPDMGHHIIYSGSCLRNMEQTYGMDAEQIVRFHYQQGHKFTRLDIAIDVNEGFTAREAIERYEKNQALSKLRKANKIQAINGRGDTLYLGRRGGDRMVRIYDKAAEQNQEGKWTRIEIETRAFGAKAVLDYLMSAKNAKKAIYATIKGIVDYPQWKDWNEAMTGDAMVLKLDRKVTSATEEWLLQKVAPSLAKFAIDHEGFLDNFEQHVHLLMAEMIGQRQSVG